LEETYLINKYKVSWFKRLEFPLSPLACVKGEAGKYQQNSFGGG